MSATVVTASAASTAAPVKIRHFKLAISLSIVTVLLALLFLLAPRTGESRFRLGDARSVLDLPTVSVPTAATS